MFRTPIHLTPLEDPFNIKQKFLAMGSCFANIMGLRMSENKFEILVNPLGVLYHPLALFRGLEMAYNNERPHPSSYIQHQGIYYNYHFHGDLSHTTKTGLQKLIDQRLTQIKQCLEDADCLILTFGSAFQYVLKETDQGVANCHKMPSQLFTKQCTSIEGLVSAFLRCMELLKIPRVLISVSPVRHLRDGLVNNSLSKSTLRVACQQMTAAHPTSTYFPGYEMVLDDLRDYRFYGKDMAHTNDLAHDYIWDRFVKFYLDQNTQEFLLKWEKIHKNLKHRPFHDNSTAYREFLQSTLKLIDQLPENIDTHQEVDYIKSKLT